MSVLTVGSGKLFSRLSDAVNASKDGDVIQVQAGTYYNDTATINTKITIEGVGGMAHLVSTQPISNGKGILVTNTDVTLKNMEFSGATVADQNGAGVRYQGGHLTIQDSYFHDNENGILGNPVSTGVIDITRSEFAHNGAGDGQTHGIYIGKIAKVAVTDSYFHDTEIGHHIKSRAAETVIQNSRIVDGEGGTASYSIDLPNGGKGLITGNTIVQSPTSDNPYIVAFGEEGGVYSSSSLTMRGNTISNEMTSGKGVWNATSVPADISGNSVYSLKTILVGSGAVTSTTQLSSAVHPSTSSPWQTTAPSANHAPMAVDDRATTSRDKAVTINVLGNDTDADGNVLSVTGVSSVPSNGVAQVNTNGTITYTPKAGFTGSDSFGYTIADGKGGKDGGLVDVSVAAPAITATTIAVNAYGTAAGGSNAHFNLLVDGKVIGSGYAGTAAKDFVYNTTVPLDAAHTVQLRFDNDAVVNGQDRNLFINKLTINGKGILPTDSGVTYDRGALDGKDVVAGQKAMWWNGTLSFDADASYFRSAQTAMAQSLDTSFEHLNYVQAHGAQTDVNAVVAIPAAHPVDMTPFHAVDVLPAVEHLSFGHDLTNG